MKTGSRDVESLRGRGSASALQGLPLALGTALILFWAACTQAPPAASPTAEDPQAQLQALIDRAVTRPQDASAQEACGLLLVTLGKESDAIPYLERAFDLDPHRTLSALALADWHQRAGRPGEAEAIYQRAQPRGKEESQMLQAAEEKLARALLAREMHELIAAEQQVDSRAIPAGTLAVLDFEPGDVAEEMKALGKGLSVVLTTELSRLPEIRIVERRRLQTLLEELELAPVAPVQTEPLSRPTPLDPIETIRGIQQRLALLSPAEGQPPYYQGPIDGQDGPQTLAAIVAFQWKARLPANGAVGPETRAALEEAMRAAGLVTETQRKPDRPAPDQPAPKQPEPNQSERDQPALDQRAPDQRDPEDRAASPQAAPRAGRILGARQLLGGRFHTPGDPGDEQIVVRAQVIDALDASVVAEATAEQPLESFYLLTGQLVVETASALGIDLPPEERRRLYRLPPATQSLAAFLAFGRGVDFEDRGLWDEASVAYAEAVRLDPQFARARERVEVLQIGSASFQQSVDRATRAALRHSVSSSRETLSRSLGAVGSGAAENDMRPDEAGVSRSVQADGPPAGTVRVQGQVPVGGGR